jgi:NADPH:quinone reductase-like Zn-dependent oxidoreductase
MRLLETTVGKVLGADMAGVVDAVGPGVTRLAVGDEVFGVAKGLKGAFAELACAAEGQLAKKPAHISFEAAAAVPTAATTALHGLRDQGRVKEGDRVLIHGASGGVGTFAMQIAKALGAEVTAVTSARGAAQALALGATRIIDYAREDFARANDRYDVIVAVNGHRTMWDYRRALAPGGRGVVIGGALGQIAAAAFLGPFLSLFGGRRLGFMGIAKTTAGDLAFLAELLAAAKLAPIIDRRYPLGSAAEALRYVAQGHAAGKVILTVATE